jgi:hypothetical protein
MIRDGPLRLRQHFDLLLREQRSLALRSVIESLAVPGSRFLDAGCGTGLLSLWAARAGAHVVAVDAADLALARTLADVNGVGEAIEFVQGDLREVSLNGPFDVVAAMLYHNDPRRDEGQSRLAAEIYRRHLRAGGEPVPDQVRYTARGFSWPDQSAQERWRRSEADCARLEKSYGLSLTPLSEALRREVDPSFFPQRDTGGRVGRSGARALTDNVAFVAIDYRSGEGGLPDSLSLEATGTGRLDVVVWTQELLYRGGVLFSNESVSWVHPAVHLEPGVACELQVDTEWRRTNVLSARA